MNHLNFLPCDKNTKVKSYKWHQYSNFCWTSFVSFFLIISLNILFQSKEFVSEWMFG